MVGFARSGGLWPPPQSIDIIPQISRIYTEVRLSSRGCTCLRSALPLARARSAPTEQEDGLTEFIAATFF